MKFKMQDKQNQLIERISDKHLVVGVDIAQQTHVARAVNYRGIVVGDPLPFENSEEGFTRLLEWMNQLKCNKGLDTEIVGMEPTHSVGNNKVHDAGRYLVHSETRVPSLRFHGDKGMITFYAK